MDAQDAKTELEYWLQLIGDGKEELADLNQINEEIGNLIEVAESLFPAAVLNEGVIDAAETILKIVRSIQVVLGEAINRNQQTIKLITGRVKMVREELDL